VFNLIENLPAITSPSVNKIIYIYGQWQDKFNEYKNRVFFTNQLKYLTIKPNKPTLIVCDDLMTELGENKDMLNLFIKGTHHNSVSALVILQNIFEKGKIFKSLRRNNHYYYLTDHIQDKQSIVYFSRQLEPKNSEYFMQSYEDAVSRPYGGLFCDLHPKSKLRHIAKYRFGVENIQGQTLYISEKNSLLSQLE
jgi:hypothetical protein